MTRGHRAFRRPALPRDVRDADLFMADLMGTPLGSRVLARGVADAVWLPPAEEDAAPVCRPPKGSAAAYFFRQSGYLRYNIPAERVDVGPAPIKQFWHLPAEFQSNLDASINWGNGYAYFFKKGNYVRYNIATDRADLGPKSIADGWPKLPQDFRSDIDAAVNWGNGVAYFFKGPDYVRYEIAADKVEGPHAIKKSWPALPSMFQSSLDSVVNWGNGVAYFFKGANYVRYEIAGNKTTGPTDIQKSWKLPAEFSSGIKAAVNWTFPCDLAGLMRAAGVTTNEVTGWQTRAAVSEHGCFTPVGIVIHHTVITGTPAYNDIVNNVKANFYVDKGGVVNVVSAGRSNHAGKGVEQVLDEVSRGIAPSGTAAARRLQDGPFVGNGHFYGFENENKGDGVDPWPEVQVAAIAKGAAALCQRHGWSANRVISHSEWTSRKIDPKGIDMNAFRARVTALF